MGVSNIAQTLGIARNTVYNWMANGNAPLNQLLALEGLGIDIVYVLTGMPRAQQNEAHQVNQDVRPYGLDKDETLLLESYRCSSLDVRAAALRMLAGAAPKAAPRQPKTAVVFDGEYKGRRTGPQVLSEEVTTPRRGRQALGDEEGKTQPSLSLVPNKTGKDDKK